MPNLVEVSNLIAKTTTEFLDQRSPILRSANREYEEVFNQDNYATGGAVNIKIPGSPDVQKGLTTTAQDLQDLILPYTITPDADMYSVVRNLNLSYQRFNILGGDAAITKPIAKAIVDNYGFPAFQAIEADIESEAALRLGQNAYMTPIDSIDKLGPINTFSAISQIGEMADIMKLSSERFLMMNVTDMRKVSDSLQNMYNEAVNRAITLGGKLGGKAFKGIDFAGFDLFQCPDMPNHTAGTAYASNATLTVDSVAADGGSITFTGLPSTLNKLFNAGDLISIPSVYLVRKLGYQITQYRLVVVAAEDAFGDGAGNATVTLSYPIAASGEHTNVSALPVQGAEAKVFPSHKNNYAYVSSGLSAVPVKLADIYGAVNSNTKGENGIPVKVTMQGAVLEYSNNFRTTCYIGLRAFAPYIITIPSAI